MIEFKLNGKPVKVNVPDDTPLLWAIREELGLTGTKFGCGKALCGACTVHLNGTPTRSCVLPVAAVKGTDIKTIEDLGDKNLHPVQKAWIKHSVPQCGYCQSGQIMQAVGLLESKDKLSKDEIIEGMSHNICRCGTYNKIKVAVLEAANEMGKVK